MMKRETQTVAKRLFSELEPWQAASKVFYEVLLPAQAGEGYGVGVRQVSSNCTRRVCCAALFSTRRQAQRLAHFLCENSILPAQLEGVVQDLLAVSVRATA